MNKKYLVTASILSLLATSTVQAADSIIHQEHKPTVSVLQGAKQTVSPVVVASPFSWSGSYLGGQIGGFSSRNTLNYAEDAKTGKWAWVDKSLSPKLSGFVAGLYAGSNLDLGNNFILGVDTDMVWSGKKDTEKGKEKRILDDDALASINAVFKEAELPIKRPGAPDETIPNIGDIVESSVTLKEKWTGATRVRIGFASGCVMPYVAGGIAYGQMQYIMSILSKSQEDPTFVFASGDVLDESKTMIGYTLGGGIDLAMTNNIIMRAEYRYSDFGKTKFADDKLEISSKTNNFRIGIGYKFN
ncbi:outer membrane protein [Bartonella machadoae]|uniref:outer membrane protein n=1 Tax=Bartonella machadoae TaxID=2893471 RepID=UPI001F4CB3D3|nr:outer membrane protein [Bartonella machadoae]UNE53970.1 porin family protein [Bartonella machadoae]